MVVLIQRLLLQSPKIRGQVVYVGIRVFELQIDVRLQRIVRFILRPFAIAKKSARLAIGQTDGDLPVIDGTREAIDDLAVFQRDLRGDCRGRRSARSAAPTATPPAASASRY